MFPAVARQQTTTKPASQWHVIQVRLQSPSALAVFSGQALDLQAEIDLQSGILNAEERDFKTAFSYFFEAFEQYNNLKSPKALNSLKYLLLCKIMSNNATEVASIISSKSGLNYSGPELEAMKLVAEARTQSSLTMLQVPSAVSLYFAEVHACAFKTIIHVPQCRRSWTNIRSN